MRNEINGNLELPNNWELRDEDNEQIFRRIRALEDDLMNLKYLLGFGDGADAYEKWVDKLMEGDEDQY